MATRQHPLLDSKIILLRELKAKAINSIEAADEFYFTYANVIVPIEEYIPLKRRIILPILQKKVQEDIQSADKYYSTYAEGIVSVEHYNSIKRPVLLDALQMKVQQDIQSADKYYFKYAKGIVSYELYYNMKRPILLTTLQKKVQDDIQSADNYYFTYAKVIISPEHYKQIKKPVILALLQNKVREDIQSADNYYFEFAKEILSLECYNSIKSPIILAALQKKAQEDFRSSDKYYFDYAKEVVSIEDYNNIKKPILLNLLQNKVRVDIQAADMFYIEYARGIVSVEEYNQLKKPRYLKLLQAKLEEDYLGVNTYYETNLSRIISKDEFDNELVSFVIRWFFYQRQANKYSGNLPDGDQAAAIAAVNGNVLVTARAGSGKTATLINRAYFMIKHCRIAPSEILMLAFNKKAADEMKIRMAHLLRADKGKAESVLPHIMTFHALAHSLVHPMERILYDDKIGARMLSRVVQDDIIDKYLQECIKLPWVYDLIRELMMHYFKDPIDEDRWLSRDEYLKARRCVQESLKGDNVKSYGEKRIANFLFEHDISYKYEQAFRWNERTYRPDFTVFSNGRNLEKRGVVIEYFGLAGNPDYDKESENKRKYWKNKPAWSLLEIYPENINLGESGFDIWLKKKLNSFGIKCNKLSED